jgi:hypothetical protein
LRLEPYSLFISECDKGRSCNVLKDQSGVVDTVNIPADCDELCALCTGTPSDSSGCYCSTIIAQLDLYNFRFGRWCNKKHGSCSGKVWADGEQPINWYATIP